MKIRLLFSSLVAVVLSAAAFAQEIPQFKTQEEKEMWKKEHPEFVKQNSVQVETGKVEIAVQPESTGSGGQNVNNLPSGFPVFQNTGNPEQDALTYHKAKEEWVKNNPEKYRDYVSGISDKNAKERKNVTTEAQKPDFSEQEEKPEVIRMSKDEFNAYNAERQKYILENSQLFIIYEK